MSCLYVLLSYVRNVLNTKYNTRANAINIQARLCANTIRGRIQFEGEKHSRKYGMLLVYWNLLTLVVVKGLVCSVGWWWCCGGSWELWVSTIPLTPSSHVHATPISLLHIFLIMAASENESTIECF